MKFDKLKIIIGVALVIFVFLSAVIIVSGLIVDKAVKQGTGDNMTTIIDNKTKTNTVAVVNTPVTPVVNTPASNTPAVDAAPQPVVTPTPTPQPMMPNPPMRRTRAS